MKRSTAIILLGFCLAAANPSAAGIRILDAEGREFAFDSPPERIISLAPSITGMFADLGAADRLIGFTRFCRPPEKTAAVSVGGLSDPSVEAMVALRPDLVAATPMTPVGVRSQLESFGIRVLLLEHSGIEGTLEDYARLERLTGGDGERTRALRERLDAARIPEDDPRRRPRVLLLYDVPGGFYTATASTFPGEIIQLAGGHNVAENTASDWPRVSMETLLRWRPEIILLAGGEAVEGMSGDGPRASRRDPLWQRLPAVRAGRVHRVEERWFAVPGTAAVEAVETVVRLLHREAESVSEAP